MQPGQRSARNHVQQSGNLATAPQTPRSLPPKHMSVTQCTRHHWARFSAKARGGGGVNILPRGTAS